LGSVVRGVIGSPATVKRGLTAFLQRTRVDELMVTAAIHDQAARLRSFEIVAQVRDEL
jgi:alkanesulfonate monooxygenase SsuD/methylene tetrahydromethanopterin reductase-like flavin-dependent oxidoreductase (luciferase family)